MRRAAEGVAAADRSTASEGRCRHASLVSRFSASPSHSSSNVFVPAPLSGDQAGAVRSSAMRSRLQGPWPSEVADFGDEIRRVFVELGRSCSGESLAGQCSPPIDVYEKDDAMEIVMDLPGVEAAAVRVVARGDTILIVGEKAARRPRPHHQALGLG